MKILKMLFYVHALVVFFYIEQIRRLAFWFRSFKRIETVSQAKEMGLTHTTNIFGDMIIHQNWARSIWHDGYGNAYRCDELLPGGRDAVIEQLKKEMPELFRNF